VALSRALPAKQKGYQFTKVRVSTQTVTGVRVGLLSSYRMQTFDLFSPRAVYNRPRKQEVSAARHGSRPALNFRDRPIAVSHTFRTPMTAFMVNADIQVTGDGYVAGV
jgi:hypothetical protein